MLMFPCVMLTQAGAFRAEPKLRTRARVELATAGEVGVGGCWHTGGPWSRGLCDAMP